MWLKNRSWMEHWESSIKKEQERIQIKFKLLNKFKYIFVNFLDGGYGGYNFWKIDLHFFWKLYPHYRGDGGYNYRATCDDKRCLKPWRDFFTISTSALYGPAIQIICSTRVFKFVDINNIWSTARQLYLKCNRL